MGGVESRKSQNWSEKLCFDFRKLPFPAGGETESASQIVSRRRRGERVGRGLGAGRGLGEGVRGLGEGWERVGEGWERVGRGLGEDGKGL